MKPLIAIAIKWLILGTFLQSYQISQIRSYVYICCHAFVNKQGYHEYYFVLFVKNIILILKISAQNGYTFKFIQFKRNIIGHPICISIRSRRDYPGLLLSFLWGLWFFGWLDYSCGVLLWIQIHWALTNGMITARPVCAGEKLWSWWR